MNKLIFLFTVSSLIYSYFFYKLGNTIFRINQFNQVRFSLIPLFTEGFIGPIRTFFLLIKHEGIFSTLQFLFFELFRLSNPFSALFFVFMCNAIYNLIFSSN